MARYRVIFFVTFCSILFAAFVLPTAKLYAANISPECSDPASPIKDQSVCQDVSEVQTTSSNHLYGPDGILTKAASIITYIGGISAVIMIILAGFSFVTGSGDANGLAAARKTLIYAVVGLVVLVIPSAIIRFVISRL